MNAVIVIVGMRTINMDPSLSDFGDVDAGIDALVDGTCVPLDITFMPMLGDILLGVPTVP